MDTREKHQGRRNPQESSNIISLLFFGWMIPIFWKGAKRDLQVTDLYDPLKYDESGSLGDRLQTEWEKELIKADGELVLGKDGKKKARKQPSLTWAIVRVFWVRYMIQGLLLFVQLMVLKILQPILQGWIIDYFNPGQDTITRNDVFLYAGYLILVTLGIVFITHHTNLQVQKVGMCIRVACCSLIYRKVLRLNQAALNNTAAGQVANLISNDVARFDFVPLFLHFVWIMPMQVLLIGYVMWQSVGIAALVGIGAMMLQTIPIQGYMSHVSAKFRSKIAVKTDHRVQLMSELISGIQVVKMYSWEKPFDLIVSKVRALEMKLIAVTTYLRGIYLSIMVFSERMTLYLTLITFVLMGNTLTADVSFVLSTLFNVLQMTCAICFPQAIIMAGETAVSLKRLTDFLLLDEIKVPENVNKKLKNGTVHAEKEMTGQRFENGVGIEMVNVAANWVHGQLPPTLCQVTMNVGVQSLSVLVGSVGSGKSSLLHLILGELRPGAGSVNLYTSENGVKTIISPKDIRISYASQDPWLFSASIRDNILFGQPYDRIRYQEVTRVCALLKDFEQLPQGDMSFVGERGASLSGGQRARVNLARAVYRDADLYLLDDPLSAVDARVGRHLFEECIQGYLKGKTRILVTHQLQYLSQADSIIVLDRGTVEHQGTYSELGKTNITHVLDSHDSEKRKIEETAEGENNDPNTHASSEGDDVDRISQVAESVEEYRDVSEEEMATGEMSNKVYWGYFKAGGNTCFLAFLLLVFIAAQLSSSGTDYWVTYWTNQEILKAVSSSNSSVRAGNDSKGATTPFYDEYGVFRTDLAVYIYTGCIILCIFLTSMRSFLFMRNCINSSRNIHNTMFSNLLRATMRFFNTNPSGRILNRFSKDIGSMDELLPRVMLETLQIFSIMIGILIMVVVVNYWMAIPTVIMISIFYVIRVYFLKTAQDVKRLEGITKSPVFSHVTSTLDGLTTIRSRGSPVAVMLRKEFDDYQDSHTAAWYLTIASGTAFGFFLDLISCCFITCVCFSFILLDDGYTLGGSVGLAISQSLILTGMVQYGIKQSTDVISQMTSVERVLQYTTLPQEGPFTTDNPPPPTWPSKGALVFKEVSMKYAEDKPPVLKNLNVNIKPGWKIGIAGRTGAGKSSLISALFHLTGDGLEGEILLDGIDTKSIGLQELRPRISIIPQEPILFSASLRYNLDPFDQYSDTQLWDSLREVELGDAIPSLEFQVAGGGANLSVGQRQLICLARAILRNNRLLVLDEATANVDRGTDALVQNTIRRRFADCTVLTIAHRLNTIMDSDRVIVMEGGRIVEFGHPHVLLKNRNGPLSLMVQQTSKGMAEKLAEIAEEAYQTNPEFAQAYKSGVIVDGSNNQITYL
ncbi:ATP-binding cassette subfamily C member 4-like [Neodiprion virginianus]|uniref:ATP-binding cassette subfamily C member 4-like n=1 Tax=Neodiprion virginianus TaxID=2961670 RepID=UPI001EE72DD7|nr:ATP-binding cassette subfamily C member 4-like [Neodiprion virginianus]XP_046622341.1 ATP-binding cassette subfamily C member 4-like [Neodiprion virginianus]